MRYSNEDSLLSPDASFYLCRCSSSPAFLTFNGEDHRMEASEGKVCVCVFFFFGGGGEEGEERGCHFKKKIYINQLVQLYPY